MSELLETICATGLRPGKEVGRSARSLIYFARHGLGARCGGFDTDRTMLIYPAYRRLIRKGLEFYLTPGWFLVTNAEQIDPTDIYAMVILQPTEKWEPRSVEFPFGCKEGGEIPDGPCVVDSRGRTATERRFPHTKFLPEWIKFQEYRHQSYERRNQTVEILSRDGVKNLRYWANFGTITQRICWDRALTSGLIQRVRWENGSASILGGRFDSRQDFFDTMDEIARYFPYSCHRIS